MQYLIKEKNAQVNDTTDDARLNRMIIICTENNSEDFFGNLVVQELAVRLTQASAKNVLPGTHKLHHSTTRFAHVVEYIRKNLEENITVKTLSRKACMSRPHFFRCFKQEFGMSPVEYVIGQRIKAAKMMLLAAALLK